MKFFESIPLGVVMTIVITSILILIYLLIKGVVRRHEIERDIEESLIEHFSLKFRTYTNFKKIPEDEIIRFILQRTNWGHGESKRHIAHSLIPRNILIETEVGYYNFPHNITASKQND